MLRMCSAEIRLPVLATVKRKKGTLSFFPASRPLVRGSNLEELITEITYYIKLK